MDIEKIMSHRSVFTAVLILNGLLAQNSFSVAGTANNSGDSYSHEQELYASQIRSSCRPMHKLFQSSENIPDSLPADIQIIISFNSGLKIPALTIISIRDGRLVVRDKNGRFQEILLDCITQIEIPACEMRKFENKSGGSDNDRWLPNLFARNKKYILSLGWLTMEEKIELLQLQFIAA